MDEFRFDLWLQKELKKRKMRQTDLAKLAQLHQSTVFYLVHNQRLPRLETVLLVLDALGMHLEIVNNEKQ